jgi:hypothetical protein
VSFRFGIRFTLGFAASSVNPLTVVDGVNSFCTAVFCGGQAVDEAFIEVFGGRREFLSHCQLVLMCLDRESNVGSAAI